MSAGASPSGIVRAVAIRLALIALGYFPAVAAATIVTVALMLAPTALPDDGAWGSIYASLRELPIVLAGGFIWTFICALPGFVIAILLSEASHWRGWRSYALAGCCNVAPSLAISAGLAGTPLEMPGMVAAAFPGGLAGGAAYWASAGRFAAARRRQT